MGVVRASSLPLAELCPRAPWLSEKFHEGTAAAQFGSEVDRQVSDALITGVLTLPEGQDILPEVKGILDWVARMFPADAEFHVQRRLTLLDPETGEELSRGTADLVVVMRAQRRIVVIDWKTLGQWWAGHLRPPENNLQQLAYLAAAVMEFSMSTPIDSGKIILACFDEDGVSPKESPEIPVSGLWDVIRRVKAIPRIDPNGREPEAMKGDHCASCYRHMHCSAYLLPAMGNVPVALVPFTKQGELTAGEALDALGWLKSARAAINVAKKLADLVEEDIDAFVHVNGPVVDGDKQYGAFEKTGNRSGPTLAELEESGKPELMALIKPGKKKVSYGWKPLTYRMAAPGPLEPKEEKKPRAKKEAAPKLTRKQPAQIEATATEGNK